jgi:hypothetical protein
MKKDTVIKLVGVTAILIGVAYGIRYFIQKKKRKVTTNKGDFMIPEEVGMLLDGIMKARKTGSNQNNQMVSSSTQQQIIAELDANNNGLIDSTEGGVTTNSQGQVVAGVPTMEYLQQQLDNM